MKNGDAIEALTPEDLTAGLPNRQAIALALESIQATDWPEFKWHGPTPGPVLETLLTFAYARGIYSSTDVELACQTESAFRYCAAGERPDANELRQFRRAFKPWIEQSLRDFCERLLFLGHARIQSTAKAEAARRILAAIQLDNALFEI